MLAVFDVCTGLIWYSVTQSEAAIVEALAEQDDVGQGVIDCENDLKLSVGVALEMGSRAQTHHSRQHLLCYSTNDVCEITEEPYYDKLDAETLSTASPEILDDLRRENHNPACCCVSVSERSIAF